MATPVSAAMSRRPGYVTESVTASAASCSAAGTCTYTFTHAVPAGATGTYAIGLEARRTETVLAGQPNQQSMEYGASNPVSYFSVDGSTVAPRRLVVALRQLQPVPRRALTARDTAQQHLILRDVPQPVEYGRFGPRVGHRRGGQGAAAAGNRFQQAGASHPLRPQRHGGWREESVHRGRVRRKP